MKYEKISIKQLPHYLNKNSGFGLVELMISIVIGLLIVSALLTLFVNTSRTNSEMAKTNNLIENGRFAIQLLESDIVHAGYWGTHVPEFDDFTNTSAPADLPDAVPDPCLVYNSTNWNDQYKNNLVGISLQGYEIGSPVPSPTLSVCASKVVNPKANTDVLVVRHAEVCLLGETNCEADVSGELYFQSSLCATDTIDFIINTSGYSLLNRNCSTVADKRKFISNIYYIRDYAQTAGDGIPTLVRSQFNLSGSVLAHQDAVALIEGIEGFHVEYGIDNLSETNANVDYTAAVNWQDPATKKIPTNRGDGIPDEYISCTTASPCNNVDNLINVTSVKIYILVRNRETTANYTDTKTYTLGDKTLGPFNDNYKRHVFSSTIRLTNISGRRETP